MESPMFVCPRYNPLDLVSTGPLKEVLEAETILAGPVLPSHNWYTTHNAPAYQLAGELALIGWASHYAPRST